MGTYGTVSGFDPLFTAISRLSWVSVLSFYVTATSTEPTILDKFFKFFGQGPLVSESDSTNPSYMERRHVQAAIEVLNTAQSEQDSLVFLSAAENQYCGQLSRADDSIKKRIVLFLHQPPSWFKKHWHDFSVFDGLRALVCLSSVQKDYFSGITSSPVMQIHHGVKHDFFIPSQLEPIQPPRLLFVGQWLRDFRTLHASMQEVWASMPRVTLDCVIPSHVLDKPGLSELKHDSRVRWHEGIEPEALRDLYQKATLLFLPLIDCAANNAILEAMACGLPIISSNVGGIRDYVNTDYAVLCPPDDVKAHASAVLNMLEDDEFRSVAGKKSREFVVQRLDWSSIAGGLLASLDLPHRIG